MVIKIKGFRYNCRWASVFWFDLNSYIIIENYIRNGFCWCTLFT